MGFLRESRPSPPNFFPGPHSQSTVSRKEVERHTIGRREDAPTSVTSLLSNECKRILHYAFEEADRLGHKHIGTEHAARRHVTGNKIATLLACLANTASH